MVFEEIPLLDLTGLTSPTAIGREGRMVLWC